MTLRARAHDLAKILRYVVGALKASARLSLFADSHGKRAIFIGASPIIVNRGRFVAGSHFRVRGAQTRALIETAPDGIIQIGDEVFINQGSCIFSALRVQIGNRVDIGDDVRIYDTAFHPVRPGEPTKVAEIVIEDDVWLASGCAILAGVTVGRGSVVSAGAIVTRSVPAGSVVAGVPAKVVGSFDVPESFRRRSVA